jgi:hypothetical protein
MECSTAEKTKRENAKIFNSDLQLNGISGFALPQLIFNSSDQTLLLLISPSKTVLLNS